MVWYHGTTTLQPDLSQKLESKGRVVGGTGDSKGATGRFKVTGKSPGLGEPFTLHLRGTLRY